MGAGLKLSRDGSAAAVWSVNDSKLKYAVLASLWRPGGPWGAHETIQSRSSFVQGPWDAVVPAASMGDFGTAWMASNSASPPQTAYFYATTQDFSHFLPLAVK